MKTSKNNIEYKWSMLAKGSSVDQESNLLSVFEILEELKVDIKVIKETEFLVLPIQFQLISLWEKKVKDSEVKRAEILVECYDPNGKLMNSLNHDLVIPADKKRMRLKIHINGLKLTASGNYIFKLSKQEEDGKMEKIAEIPLEVILNKTIEKANP
jgi:hypothetical protein